MFETARRSSGDEIAADEAVVAAHDALDLEPRGRGRPHDGPDGGVDAAAVPGQDGDPLQGFLSGVFTGGLYQKTGPLRAAV
ncbi:MAG: hypothetical protein MZV64_18830 [Ignavibacteriales bacterium]|nr:hypothetical protein [Ignavibacteriales bacterium]